MKTTAKELKKWLEKINDEALISVNVYKNNREKTFIVATEWDENGKFEEKEFKVSEEE